MTRTVEGSYIDKAFARIEAYKKIVAQRQELDMRFAKLGIGQIGEPKPNKSDQKITAFDVVESFRTRTEESQKPDYAETLGQLLAVNHVPTVQAVAIGVLWGECYGSTPIQP